MTIKAIQFPLLFPEDLGGGGSGVADKPKPEVFDDDTTLLDDLLDKAKPGKDKVEEDDDKDEDEDLLGDDDDDLGDKDDDDEDDLGDKDEDKDKEEDLIDTNIRAVDFKKIKEKYGDFSKTNEFRELRNAYHREAQFTELFPTVEDAREASENNETFTKLNDALVNNADATVLLTAIKEANPESVEKFSLGFLDNLDKFDHQLFIKTITPVVKRLARQLNADGRKILSKNRDSEDGQALVATARNITLHFFDDPDLADKDDEPKEDPRLKAKEDELKERENKIVSEKFHENFRTVAGAVDRHLVKAITDGLDPDGRMNEFTRDTLVEKIKQSVFSQLDKDTPHIKRMQSLWKRATSDGYSRESLSRIVAAYLERARPVISTSRAKYKSIALKGSNRSNGREESVRIPNRGQSGRSAPRDGKVNLRAVDTKKIDYGKTSDEDIFEGRAKLKG